MEKLIHPKYPKLAETGAVDVSWHAGPDRSNGGIFGLTPCDTDQPEKYIYGFVDAVFRDGIIQGNLACFPNDLAKSCGRPSLTFQEYVSELKRKGLNTKKFHEFALALGHSYEQSVVSRKVRAAAFFELIKTEAIVTNEEVRELIDNESIYELLELVLAHADTTRARIKAIKRHAENRSMKADVFTWLDSQAKFKSIEAAATAITKQQPIAHVTGRDWYKEWKKLRSASTP